MAKEPPHDAPPAPDGQGPGGKLSFEQSLAKLEEIVEQIEQGEVPLEESIDRYAQGIELIKQCRSILARAEKKIQVLAKSEGGALELAGELASEDEE